MDFNDLLQKRRCIHLFNHEKKKKRLERLKGRHFLQEDSYNDTSVNSNQEEIDG